MTPTPQQPDVRELLRAVEQNLVWRSNRDGRAYRGSGKPGLKAPDITEAVDRLIAAGWIVKRSITSAVYELTDAGRAAIARSHSTQPTEEETTNG